MESHLIEIAGAIILFVGGILAHAWFTRQKSNVLRIDTIKAAAEVLVEAALSKDDAKIIEAAQERQQATALAVSQALQKLSQLTQPK